VKEVKPFIFTTYQAYSPRILWGEIPGRSRILYLIPAFSDFKKELNLNLF